MNTPTTVSFSPTDYLRHCTLSWLLVFLLSVTGQAADLTFTPNAPIVEQGKQITLSVSGTSGEVTWTVAKGQIQGTGTQVTYVAPGQVGLDVVTVMDGGGNVATVKIVVTPLSQTVSLQMENANWEVFTNRSEINALLLSEDGKTLWVGTRGGLEKRDAQTGEVQQVFLNTDGLPSNDVSAILPDDQSGLWVGTSKGLARYAQGRWQVFNTDNSGLPSNYVLALHPDSQGGLWVGTSCKWNDKYVCVGGGLAHYTQGQWQVFNTDNSGLPDNNVTVLQSDSQGQGGLWVGTWKGGLALYAQGQWQVFNTGNSGLPDNWVRAFLSDSQGGLWVGTENGLAHYAQGQWQVFNMDNSSLPANEVSALLGDGQGGLWVITYKGLAHLSVVGQWQVFNLNLFNQGLSRWISVITNLIHDLLSSSSLFSLLTSSPLMSDGQGGLWVGTDGGGLAHYTVSGQWQVFDEDHSDLPGHDVLALLSDNQSGLWVGTGEGGLAHYSSSGEWQVFNKDNSGLPDNWVYALLADSQGGLWVGTSEGLAHYAQGQWQVFKIDNSGLPDNAVKVILSDSQGGLWVGTDESGLAHYAQGQWQVFNTDNSGLPSNAVLSLLSDSQGGLWVGTARGLAHYTAQGQWQVFNTENSSLLDNQVNRLLLDSQGGLLVGTPKGLAHYAQGQWQAFNTDNSGLPANGVSALLSDSQGGLWVGTSKGLAYYAQGQWQVFNTDNSSLSDNLVLTLLPDSQGGLWVGTFGGLTHLTFTQKTALCQTTDATTCENLQATKRAAILIAGGGADSSNTLWDTTEAITSYLYKVFNKRGFDNDEIYYLSPKAWADFNGDGIDDRIVDAPKPERPLTPEDVRLALEWAKGLGKLDQPLYLFFVDHGGTEKFQLSKLEYLEVTTLKTWLDDYQTVTGNQVMMVIDACHSGQLLESLKAPNRAIISSTSDGFAYFERTDKRGFSRFFAAGLLKGMNFWEAFGYAGSEQTKLLGEMSEPITASTGAGSELGQVPRFYDGSDEGQWLKQIYLNGSFAAGDLTLAVESLTTATTVAAGTSLPLKAKAVLAAGLIKRVWAVIRPPKMNLVMDSNGTPILVLPQLTLATSGSEKDVWEATWQEAIYNGNYQVTFYAEDNQGNIASSDLPVVITVTGGIEPPPQALVQLNLEKSQYQFGERFTATLTEQLSWGYDLYAAVLLPDGQTFVTLKNPNEFAPLNEPKPWRARRVQTQPVTWIDMTLPDTLPTGQYCLFGILSPEGGDVFEALSQGLWVSEKKCFEVVP